MTSIRVSNWEGVESFEINDQLAKTIGNDPHFVIKRENGYLYCEVRNGERALASSTYPLKYFPIDLSEADKPKHIFFWLFPSYCF